ncbi:MAG TPA: hypothetical protein PK771_03860 [Spirochaetota bacterium]|nr:hypothetical protein [Spirochaetota bacterium]
MKKIVLLFLFALLVGVSCNSFSKIQKKKRINANFSLYVEEKSNKQVSFTQLKSRGIEIIAKYIFGANFKNIDSKNIEISSDNSLQGDMYEKTKSKMSNIDFDGKSYFLEEISIKYTPNKIKEKFKKKITVTHTTKSKSFWEGYNDLLTDTIRKNTKSKDRGIIIPSGNLSVKLQDQFILTCKFDIYIY